MPKAIIDSFRSGDDGLQVVFLSRKDRIDKFGLDCGDGLKWHGWEPGGDYPQKLLVKNVSTITQRVRYKLPATKFFFMEFPETILLSPGMSFTIVVSFRPIVRQAYSDYIQFSAEKGTFFVPVAATLPRLAVDIDESVDFGYCPIREKTVRTITMKNTGDIPAPYVWKVESPYKLTPTTGELMPGKSQTVTISFVPTLASSLDGYMECKIGGTSLVKTVRVTAISKFPYISLAQKTIDFGEVLTGKRVDKQVLLRNQSEVHATYQLVSLDTDRDPVFLIKPPKGVIPPGESVTLRIMYAPQSTGTFSSDRFLFKTPGGNSAHLTLNGTAVGPQVELDVNCMEFGDLILGQKASRNLKLQNNSNQSCPYEFANNQLGSFHIDRPSGIIPPQLSVIVTVTFKPLTTINYYKRLYILLKNQTPQFLDLIGTCYDHNVRPAPLLAGHVMRWRRCAGINPHLRRTTPHKLITAGVDSDQEWQEELGGGLSVSPRIYQEYFADSDNQSKVAEVSIQEAVVNFGSCGMRGSEMRTIHVTNHTEAKMICMWDIPILDTEQKMGEKGKVPLFMVFPEFQDIKAGQTVEFKVAFRPRMANFYYAQRLECYCYLKTNRNFRLIDAESFSPPVKLTTVVFGNTFPLGAEQFLSQGVISVPPKKKRGLEFPGCAVGSSKYLTVALNNQGDTPLAFYFPEPSDPTGTFSVKPAAGVVKKNSFQLLCVRFTPPGASKSLSKIMKDDGTFTHVLECVMNFNTANPAHLRVSGRGYTCALEFVSGKSLYFKPTCRGMLSKRAHPIKNGGRIDLKYECQIPKKYQKVLKVTPPIGLLKGNEQSDLLWHFMPNEIKSYDMQIPVLVSSYTAEDPQKPSFKQRMMVNIKGDCTDGIIQFNPTSLDFKTVQVNSQGQQQSLFIKNASDCALKYHLTYRQLDVDEVDSDAASPIIGFDNAQGELPAGSQKRIQVFFRPNKAVPHKFELLCHYGDANQPDALTPRKESIVRKRINSARKTDADYFSQAQQFELLPSSDSVVSCGVVGKGGFPTLNITDARYESETNLNRDLLTVWRQLSLDSINHELVQPLSEIEDTIITDACKLRAFSAADLIHHLKSFEFNLGIGKVSGPTATVFLRIDNTEPLDVEWSVRFPDDMDVALEQWADTGEPDRATRWQQAISDKELFVVHPRSGHLKTGEHTIVSVSYFHHFPGMHVLPVILQIKKGKQLCLRLIGETVHEYPQKLTLSHLPPAYDEPLEERIGESKKRTLLYRLEDLPTCLSDEEAPIQTFPLINHSGVPLRYKVDTEPLLQARADNFDVNVWKVLNPTGVVEPNGVMYLEMIFRPFEAKKYEITLPIHFLGDKPDTQDIVFTAAGFLMPESSDQSTEGVFERSTEVALAKTSFPSSQLMVCPGQICRLSNDFLAFGDMPCFASSEACIAVHNVTDKQVSFEWPTAPGSDRTQITFKPSKGTIGPKGFVMVLVKVISGNVPILFDQDLVCKIEYVQGERNETPRPRGTYFPVHSPRSQRLLACDACYKQGLSFYNIAHSKIPTNTRHCAGTQEIKADMKAGPGFDFYGEEKIVSEKLGNRTSVITNDTISWSRKTKATRHEPTPLPNLKGESLTQRSMRSEADEPPMTPGDITLNGLQTQEYGDAEVALLSTMDRYPHFVEATV